MITISLQYVRLNNKTKILLPIFQVWFRNRRAKEKKRRKPEDSSVLPTPPNSFAPSNERAEQQGKTYQYPALASAVDIANPGSIRLSAIYAAQSHESATPCYPPANSNQTYNPML